MHALDFLSESPNIFIFQKETNKTNFGGVLFLIYIIIMILISLVYILDFSLNDQYTYEAITFYNHTDDDKEIERRKTNPELNPLLNLTIITVDFDENLYILDTRDEDAFEPKIIPRDKKDKDGHYIYNLKGRVNDIRVAIFYYYGEDANCSSLREHSESLFLAKIADINIEIQNMR